MFSFNVKNFPITFRNASVLHQSECTCLHKTVIIVVFFVKSNENNIPKRASTHANVQSCLSNEKRECDTYIMHIVSNLVEKTSPATICNMICVWEQHETFSYLDCLCIIYVQRYSTDGNLMWYFLTKTSQQNSKRCFQAIP